MKYGKRPTETKGTGFDRIRAWGLGNSYLKEDETQRLDEQWEVMRRNPAHEVLAKVLDIRFGITGKPHTVRDTAKLTAMPFGTAGGKIWEAVKCLVDTKVPVTFAQTFHKVVPPAVIAHKVAAEGAAMRRWRELPAGDRQWIAFGLLKLLDEQEQSAQMANRHGLPEVSAECWRLADTLRAALRVLECEG